MCGIAGIFSPGASSDWLSSTVKKMTDVISYRGPDADGHWIDAESGVALGHRRLSIIDLSPTGAQPMFSHTGRYAFIFNGETYNFLSIRPELEALGHTFKGTSDTEVMLHAFEEWGVEASLPKFNGMYAFALYDKKERTLYLVRDRMGVKPLSYGKVGPTFVFGSEIKALRAGVDSSKLVIDSDSVAELLRFAYIPTPGTIYKNFFKLPPASYLKIPADWNGEFSPELDSGAKVCPRSYWTLREVASEGMRAPFRGTRDDAIDEVSKLLLDSVRIRMISDVPLGAFLSGGIDSSTVVALMQAQNGSPVRTFSIGFEDKRYNEAPFAKTVAEHLGTRHTEEYLSSQEAMRVIEMLPQMFDEPFGDSSQIPTFLVSRIARKHVTVSLSGDGGDELFAGYNRYVYGQKLWNSFRWIPRPVRGLASRAMRSVPSGTIDSCWNGFRKVLPFLPDVAVPGTKMHKAASWLESDSLEALYWQMTSFITNPEVLKYPYNSTRDPSLRIAHSGLRGRFERSMMFNDTLTYLPDDILVKVDRASMACSLESREPLLDYRLVEFLYSVPDNILLGKGESKTLLRAVLKKYLPEDKFTRPKMGFGIPLGEWLRNGLRDWAEAHLSANALQRSGLFNPKPIREMWTQHASGKVDWQYHLWNVLMFQAWFVENHK